MRPIPPAAPEPYAAWECGFAGFLAGIGVPPLAWWLFHSDVFPTVDAGRQFGLAAGQLFAATVLAVLVVTVALAALARLRRVRLAAYLVGLAVGAGLWGWVWGYALSR